MTSGHFEWASTAIKKDLFKKGPAKSRWTLSHGLVGHNQGCKGALAGLTFTVLQAMHCPAHFSSSLSRPGHQKYDLAMAFIRVTPRWVLWSSSRMRARNLCGTTTRFPHSRQSPWVDKSHLFSNGLSSTTFLSGHPTLTYWCTLLKTGSCLVAVCICSAVIGRA